jgi:exopolyphosphatase/guanosine-5'-triphosphate,3'-diphosphate pyrophosphatase
MKKVAAIDMGSNAIRLGLATIKSVDDYYVLDRIRTPIRLGAEAFSTGFFSEDTIENVVNCFDSFKHRMEMDGVEKLRTVATSAFRNASNSVELANAVSKSSGINIEVIEGAVEAEMIRTAVATKLSLEGKDWLLIDIGGGSVELSIFIKGEFKDSISLPLGTVRLMQNLKWGRDFNELIDEYAPSMDRFFGQYEKVVKHFRVIGTGGNFRRLLKLKRRILPRGRGDRIYPDEIMPILKILERESLEQRMLKFNLKVDAADVILPALYLINNILCRTRVKKIYTPEVGLIDSLFIEMSRNL